MLFAYLHPSFEAALQRIDKLSTGVRLFIRSIIIAGQLLTISWAPAGFLLIYCVTHSFCLIQSPSCVLTSPLLPEAVAAKLIQA